MALTTVMLMRCCHVEYFLYAVAVLSTVHPFFVIRNPSGNPLVLREGQRLPQSLLANKEWRWAKCVPLSRVG